MSNPLLSFVFPKTCINTVGQAPPTVTSNWKSFQFPQDQSLRRRLMFQAFTTASDQSADPFLFIARGARMAIAPQGYNVSHIHTCDGVPLGIYVQGQSKELVYIGLADLGTASPLEQMMALFQSSSLGVYGFGVLSADAQLKPLIDNTFVCNVRGIHTLIQGPFLSKPRLAKATINTPQPQIISLPFFDNQQPLVDSSVLVGVCIAAGEVVYIYGYPFDVMALGRIQVTDKLNVLTQAETIIANAEPDLLLRCKQAFVDLLVSCLNSPVASTVLAVDKQEIAISNATLFLTGKLDFVDTITPTAELDAILTQTCQIPALAGRKVCACLQLKEPHPCLNYDCVQQGYKTVDLARRISPQECEKAVAGMTINLQTCTVYNQQVAGGYIKVNNNIQQQCTQVVGNAAESVNIQKKTSSESPSPSSTSSTNQTLDTTQPTMNITLKDILYALLLLAFVAVVCGFIYFLNKRRQTQKMQSSQ